MKRVEKCVEILCGQGCGAVRESIDKLDAGVVLPETENLTDEEIQEVTKELKSIMAVYGDNCPVSL